MGGGRRALALVGLLGLSCSSTCGDDRSGGALGQLGELGNGEFVHGCLDRTDAACRLDAHPDCIVTGGRFELLYQLHDPSAISSDDIDPVLQVVPASTDFLGASQPFTARRSGRTAVLVRESGHVIDLMHLDIVSASGIEIVSEAGETIGDRLVLTRGETIMLFVQPQAEGCLVPGGALPLSMRSSLGLTRSIVRMTATDVLQLQGSALGTITIAVLLGDLERTLTIDVVEGPAPQTSTSDDPTTTGVDTTAETATETDPGTSGGSVTDTDTDTDAATSGGSGSDTGGG